MIDDMDEDEEPLVFKRSSTISKQNRLKSEAVTTLSQRKDGPSGKQVHAQNSAFQKDKTDPSAKTSHVKLPLSNSSASPSLTTLSQRKDGPSGKQVTAQNSVSQKDKTDFSAKASHVRPPLPNSLASPSSSKASPVKSPLSTSHKFSSSAEQSKHIRKENSIVSKEEKVSSKATVKQNNNDEDSDDEKPILARLPKGKMIVGKEEKKSSKNTSEPNNHAKDSEYEKPHLTRLSKEKSIVYKEKKITNKDDAESNKVSEDSDDERPVLARLLKGKMIVGKEEKNSSKNTSEPNNHAKNSEDEKPHLTRLSKEKMIVNLEKKITNKDDAESNKFFDDSDDERPVLARLLKGKMIVGKEEKNSSKNTSEPNNHAKDSEDKKPHLTRLSKEEMIVDKEKKITNTDDAESNKVSEDSDDDKPICQRRSAPSAKGNNLNHANQGVSSSNPLSSPSQKPKINVKKSSDESDDDSRPLSANFSMKSDGIISGIKSHGNGNKPLSSKLQQNGSASRDEQRKSSTLLSKRPLDKVSSSSQSSVKKLKLSDASQLLKNKPPSPKSDSEESEGYTPLSRRGNLNTSASKSSSGKLKVNKVVSFKKTTTNAKRVETKSKYSQSTKMSPKSGDGKKWTTLIHNGVIFPPLYKPHGVKMLYKGKPVDLTPEQEEVATMFAVMMETDYAQKEVFTTNFMNDWRKILGKNHVIQKFEDCDFRPIYEWHQREKEKKKLISTEEKKVLKEEKMSLEEKYMWATVDGVKEKVGNFRVEPPGLFRGRGEHPKMGKLKRRIRPSDITINIGKGVPIPECPIADESWKEVKHDNTVTWLAFWVDPINTKEFKYVFLAASSSLKGQSDKEKYEKARTLKEYIQGIRVSYTQGFVSKDTTKQQIAVATYLIDKLALRAGNEKDDDEADTVGCCTLKVENVKLIPPNKLEFDFLGKDSIRYNNVVEVELAVYKAIAQFQKGKREGDDLFNELDTSKLNAHLKELMPGLTAKVFRTYNASITLDEMLARDTKGGDVPEKISVYNRANKEVAIICNHQRTISKSHASQISRLDEKIVELKGIMDELNTDLARAKKGKPPLKDKDGKQKKNLTPEVLERKMAQTKAKIDKMERDKNTKEDLKTVALGTSKINYLDPRISVAWCKRHEVPIEKIFNKSLLAKFTWAMDCDPDFRF